MNRTLTIAKLTGNPFTLVPNETVTNWAGYAELRAELLDVIHSCRVDQVGLSEFAIIHGELGTGKSHALRYLRYLITDEQREEFASPCVYLETLKVAANMNFLALYCKIMEILVPHIRETADWLDLSVEDTAKTQDPDGRRHELEEEIEKIYSDPVLTRGYPPLSLLLRGIKNRSAEALSLLLGGKLAGSGAMEKYAKYNMMSAIDSEYDATKCLGAYVNLCTRGTNILSEGDIMARNRGFYFFFDELEIANDFRPQEALSVNQGIRDLINSCPENCCFLFGMTGDVRSIYGLLTQAVIRRMSREPLEIEPLTSEEAVEFLKQVLRAYRSDTEDPDEYPFREEALLAIAEATQIKTSSELFRGCRRVLEKSVLSGALEPGGMIDVAMVRQTL